MKRSNFALVLVVMALILAPVFTSGKVARRPAPPVPAGECVPKPPGMSPDWCKAI